jgi:nitrile hydratase accessory protein
LSRPETAPRFAGLPADETGPVFAEPWQAQAFALVTALQASGAFSWGDWAAALAAEVAAAGAADDGSRYYEHWLAALERLTVERGLTDLAALAERKAAWEAAYLRTPHGRPVELEG